MNKKDSVLCKESLSLPNIITRNCFRESIFRNPLLEIQNQNINSVKILGSTLNDLLYRHKKAENKKLMEQLNNKNENLDIPKAVNQILKYRNYSKKNIREFMDNRKSLLLIELEINQKKKRILYFEKHTQQQTDKIAYVERKLVSDLDYFNQFLEKDKKLTKIQIQEAEKISNEKNVTALILKELIGKKTDKSAHNYRLIERLVSLFTYKISLDSISSFSINLYSKNFQKQEKFTDFELDNQEKQININSVISKASPKDFKENSQGLKNSKTKKINSNFSGNRKALTSITEKNTEKRQHSSNPLNERRNSSNVKLPETGKEIKNYKRSSFKLNIIKTDDEEVIEALEAIKYAYPETTNEFSEFFLNNPINKSEFCLENTLEIVHILKNLEEDNLKLIYETQKLKANFSKTESKFEKDKIEQQKTILKLKFSKKEIVEKKDKKSKNWCFSVKSKINEKSSVDEIMNQLQSELFNLTLWMPNKNSTDYNEILKSLEDILVSKSPKIKSLDKKLLKNFLKIIGENNKREKFIENQEKEKINRKLKEEKNKNEKDCKIWKNLRDVNDRSFITGKNMESVSSKVFDTEDFESRVYFS